MGRKKTACYTCAAIKTVCSKESPCARCKRLSLVCSLGEGIQKDPQNFPRPIKKKTRFRTQHSRSSGGCNRCRQRRKKCDEKQPMCGDCGRLGLPCTFAGTSHSRSPSGPSPSASPAQLSTPPRSHVDELSPITNLPNVASIGVAQFDELPSLLFDWLTVIEEDYSSESKKTNLANSSALQVLPHERASDEDASFASLPATALSNLTGITPGALEGWTIGERHLLNHFLQSVSRSLVVVSDEHNPFLRIIVPMALENEVVRNALAALSACHLSRVYPDFSRNLLVHRTRALEGLKAEVDQQGTVEWALAGTLLLCLLEICEVDSRKWQLYLHGAHALLSSIDFEVDGAPFNFLVELYNYMCCIASVTSSNVPPIFGPARDLWESSKQRDGLTIHPLVGISGELYQLLPRINRLAAQRAAGFQDAVNEQALELEAQAIELLLQSWSPPEHLVPHTDATEVRAAAFAIQWASILRLRQAMWGSTNDEARTKAPTENIVSALSLIRPGSQMETHILFPLFMAGVGSVTKANRLTLEYRISIMETTIGFGNVVSAHKIMEETWRRHISGDYVEWESLMQTRNPGLLLF